MSRGTKTAGAERAEEQKLEEGQSEQRNRNGGGLKQAEKRKWGGEIRTSRETEMGGEISTSRETEMGGAMSE